MFKPDETRQYYADAIARERTLSSKYFREAITCKSGFREYNRLMDLSNEAQQRYMALEMEVDEAVASASASATKRIIIRKLPASKKLIEYRASSAHTYTT